MSVKTEYPKWLYPKTGEAIIVASAEERKALKGEYKESPADWPAEESEMNTEPTSPVVTDLDEIKEALKAAGFKDSQLKRKSDEELRKLHGALVQGA